MSDNTQPEAMSRESVAKMLDCSLSTFDDEFRPLLPVVEINAPGRKRPLLRWMRSDVLAFLDSRRRAA